MVYTEDSLHVLGFEMTWDMSFFLGVALVALVILFTQLCTPSQSVESLGPIERQRTCKHARLRYLFLTCVAFLFVGALLCRPSTTDIGKFTSDDSEYGYRGFEDMLVDGFEDYDADDVQVTLQSFLVTVDGVVRLFRRSDDGKFRDGLGNVWGGKGIRPVRETL